MPEFQSPDGRRGVDPQPTSYLNKFFVEEEGVISLSLRWITLVGTGLAIGLVCLSTYICWYLEIITIDDTHWPFISDVSGLPLFDRAYCLVFMFYAMTVQQMNVRAFYHLLYPITTPLYRNVTLALGIAACVVLPLIYEWDEYWFLTTHDCLALGFFILQTGFVFLTASALNANLTKFSADHQAAIKRLRLASFFLVAALAVFIYVTANYPEDVFHQAIIEWITVGAMLAWQAYASLESPYYESVKVIGKPVLDVQAQVANQL